MRTRRIFTREEDLGKGYAPALCNGSRSIRNTACYLIRNVQSALAKGEGFQTSRERCALLKAGIALRFENGEKEQRFLKKVPSILRKLEGGEIGGLKAGVAMHKAAKDAEPLPLPDREHSILSYSQLDAILKVTKDPAYYSVPAQVNQQALRRTCKSWKSFFRALGEYKKDPSKFLGRPHRPGYLEGETTAFMTSQVCAYREHGGKGYLLLPSSDTCGLKGPLICIGPALPGKYVKTELKPAFGGYFILITYECEEDDAPAGDPARIMAGDPGVDNFLALTTNFAHTPLIISGKYLKSLNRQYNRRIAKLYSASGSKKGLSKSRDRQASAVSRLRDAKIRDLFYKAAHFIGRRCRSLNVGTFILGHNKYWKQNAPFRSDTNQNFVQIPYSYFALILSVVLPRYGVSFYLQEESYTSKADFLAGDDIPVYGEVKGEPSFSGERVHRGQYRSKDGTVLNADVNGSANICRKAVPDAFADVTDFSYLWRSVDVLRMEDLVRYTGRKMRKKEAHYRELPALNAVRKQKRIPVTGVSGRVTGRDEAERPIQEAPAVA